MAVADTFSGVDDRDDRNLDLEVVLPCVTGDDFLPMRPQFVQMLLQQLQGCKVE